MKTPGDTFEVRVRRRALQGDHTLVLELVRDAAPLPPFTAGAHVDVHVMPGFVRAYSLCGDPADSGCYRLGVLRDPRSRGGSIGMHELFAEGATVRIGMPRNRFPLDAEAPYSVLLGGGIGITPMLAMAHALHAAGRPFELHYCARSRARAAFLAELAGAPFAHRVRLHFDDEDASQRLDLAGVLAAPGAAGAHCYVCGPAGFMDAAGAAALSAGLGADRIHREDFGADVDTGGAAFEVVAARSGKSVQVEPGQTVVAALEQIGIRVPVSCEEGVCGTCLCTVLEGDCDHRDVYLSEDERAANDQILVCCSRARSARLVLDL